MIDDGGDGGEDELTVSAQSLKLRTVQYNRRLPITAAGARGNLLALMIAGIGRYSLTLKCYVG